MIVREALSGTARSLGAVGVEDAVLEAEVLLRRALDVSRVELYCRLDEGLSSYEEAALSGLVGRRLTREPLAYITRSREFYGLDLYVDRRVLVPRPETELLVERVIALADEVYEGAPPLIADIGTGSGAIAVALAVNLPGARLYAVDISRAALEVARMNAERHGVTRQLTFLEGDLLDSLPEPVDVIAANLPYVDESEMDDNLVPELVYEPRVALGGGVSQICRLVGQIRGKLRAGGYVLLEMGVGQGKAVARAVNRCLPGATYELFNDLSGVCRVIQIRA